MKTHPVERRLRAFVKHFRQMPGNRLPLAVRVGCEVNFIGLLRRGAQVANHRSAPRGIDILRRETVGDVDAELPLRQVADVPHRRHDRILLPQHPPDGAGLGRRFHYQQLGHSISLPGNRLPS